MSDEEFKALCEASSFGAVARGEVATVPRWLLKALVEVAVAAERERCAKVCEMVSSSLEYAEEDAQAMSTGAQSCADEIRRA